MNEIYWITRLDAICKFLTATAIVSFLIAMALIVFVCNRDEMYDESWDYKRYLKYSKVCILVTIVSCVINIFIPTTNQALFIYGVGGTIDYIKSDETAKQLPDKCIKALDKWVENLTKEENQKENDNESK